jgi:hypothetical protein
MRGCPPSFILFKGSSRAKYGNLHNCLQENVDDLPTKAEVARMLSHPKIFNFMM